MKLSKRIVVRSDTDNHVLFSIFKAYYPEASQGPQMYLDHKHVDLELSCILSGSGIYNCDGRDYDFHPGDVFFHSGNDVHYFKAISSAQKPALLVIRFEPRLLWFSGGEWPNIQHQKLFIKNSTISRRIPADSEAAQNVCQLLSEMFAECQEHKSSYELLVMVKIMEALVHMVRHFDKELREDEAGAAWQLHIARMESSKSYILGHLSEPLSLEQLAKEACLSRSHYCSIFRKLNGVSVWEYVVAQRLDLAQYKLETTNDAIMRISEDCGFSSLANFNRAFKKAFGKTPREYRKIMNGTGE